MDGSRDYYTKGKKNMVSLVRNLIFLNDINELIYKTDSQISKTNL